MVLEGKSAIVYGGGGEMGGAIARKLAREGATVHPALVSEAEFVAAQQVRASRAAKDGKARSYLLSGLVGCGVCGRRLDSHWVHGRAGYRCRHGYANSQSRRLNEVKDVYVREDILVKELAAQLPASAAGCEPGGAGPDAVVGMVSELRASGTMIIHGGSGWVLEPA